MTADLEATNASATMKGAKMMAIAPITASVLARTAQAFVTGAEAMRSGASSPEIASQARLPANCPKRSAKIQIVAASITGPMTQTTASASKSPETARAGHQRMLALSGAYLVSASDCRKTTRDGVP